MMPEITDALNNACASWGLLISKEKKEVLHQPKAVKTTVPITLDGTPLEAVDKFICLGGMVTMDANLNGEIQRTRTFSSLQFVPRKKLANI